MDIQTYSSNDQNQGLINQQEQQAEQPGEYPTENEVISGSQNNNYQPQENYYPPPIPQGQYPPQNPPYNPDDKDPYVKPVPVPSPQAPIPPPPAPIENIPVYQPIVQNPNTIAIQVQPQPQIIPQPITIQPVLATPVVTSHVAQRQAEINRQRQEEEDCLACCQILCICLYCLALLGGGR